MEKNVGKVVQIIGPVLDIKFENGRLPNILNAIEIEHEGNKIVCEVATQLGDDTVRAIAMSSTDGLARGVDAVDTGSGIIDVVCGAPNVREGMHVALATEGGSVSGHPINAATVAGFTSYGMCCSEAELGISDLLSTSKIISSIS